MKKLITLLLVTGLIAGLAFAAEDGEKQTNRIKKDEVVPAKKGSETRPGRPTAMDRYRQSSTDRQERYRQAMNQRAERHRQEVAEIEAIKKIAEEEGATRTVQAIQKMIDKKNAAYKEGIERYNRMRQGHSEQIRQRTGRPESQKPGKDDEGAVKKESEQ